ncbi:29808_t:CDS:1 [Racocetra persica]|uniref:29808_t:CDS:1 n=1 Tax=Racocetra persica TaxID=160502 RepID=A0ACA9LR59_9GLOM|nr:29808_t:CDS:1 [Racocetra persica]
MCCFDWLIFIFTSVLSLSEKLLFLYLVISYPYVVGKNKNLPSPEAQYQEVEITEDDRIYDILRKMDHLYLLLYKVTIQIAPNNKFNPKETITTTTELNA